MKVRRATDKDIPWLVEQATAFMEYSGYRSLFDSEYLPHLVSDCVNHHLVLVALAKSEKVGMLIAHRCPHPYNPKKILLAELCWWVDPTARGTTAGATLLTTYFEWGKRNADMVTMSLMEHSPIKAASLEKRGFKRKETSFVWEKE